MLKKTLLGYLLDFSLANANKKKVAAATAEQTQLNSVANASYRRLHELFAAQPAMLYIKGCGHQ